MEIPKQTIHAHFRSSAAKIAIATALIFLAFSAPVIPTMDGGSMLAVSISLLTHGSFTVPRSSLGILGRNGQYYSSWYPLLSIIALPFVGFGLLIARVLHLPATFLAGASALTLSPLIVAGTSYFTALLARRLEASAKSALVAALAFAFGTIAMYYARDFSADSLLALLTVWAIYLQLGQTKPERNSASVLAGFAVLAKPSGIVVGPLMAAYAAATTRSARMALTPLYGTGLGLLVYCAYNVARFGHPFQFGQPNRFSLMDLPAGLSGLLLSPWGGMIWYCPIVLGLAGLGWSTLKRLDVLLVIGIFAAYLSLYSVWGDWYGGWGWGPRYLLPALPGLVASTALLRSNRRRLVVILILIGFVINAPTMVSVGDRVFWERSVAGKPPLGSFWALSDAPFVRIWGATYRELQDARHTDVKDLVTTVGNPNREKGAWRAVHIVAVWWWLLPAAGIPRFVGLFIALILCVIGILLIFAAMCRSPRILAKKSFP